MSPCQIPLRGWAAIPQKSARAGGQDMAAKAAICAVTSGLRRKVSCLIIQKNKGFFKWQKEKQKSVNLFL